MRESLTATHLICCTECELFVVLLFSVLVVLVCVVCVSVAIASMHMVISLNDHDLARSIGLQPAIGWIVMIITNKLSAIK